MDTEYNLADMGTKALNRVKQKFFLKNQKFPPVSTAGECQKVANGEPVIESGLARLVLTEQSRMDEEVSAALGEPRFVAAMMKFYGTKGK